jgi:hypothetical protein
MVVMAGRYRQAELGGFRRFPPDIRYAGRRYGRVEPIPKGIRWSACDNQLYATVVVEYCDDIENSGECRDVVDNEEHAFRGHDGFPGVVGIRGAHIGRDVLVAVVLAAIVERRACDRARRVRMGTVTGNEA